MEAIVHGGRALLSPLGCSLKPALPASKSISVSGFRLSRVIVAKASPSESEPFASLSRSFRAAASGAVVLAALASSAFRPSLARADPSVPSPPPAVEVADAESDPSVLSHLLDSNSEVVDALRSLLFEKLEAGLDSDALAILRRLIAAQPDEAEWKFLAARLLNEMGEVEESHRLYEEILATDPLSFEALFENAVLMDRLGEGEAVIRRLQQALDIAEDEQKEKAARDVRLIMAQIQFLQKNVEEALFSYEELAREDPMDYRPYFCQGVIYSLLDRNTEAREKFSKYHELAPRKFEVDGYLQTPLSREKLFGTADA